MMIWGIHVHVGVEDVNKVFPIINALAVVPAASAGAVGVEPLLGGRAHGLRVEPRARVPAAADGGTALAARGLGASSRRYLDDMVRHRRHGGRDRGAVGHPARTALGHHRGARVRRHVDPPRARRRRRARAGARRALLARARRGPRAPDPPAVVRAREQVARRPLRPRRADHRRPRGHAGAGRASTCARRSSASATSPSSSSARASSPGSRRS